MSNMYTIHSLDEVEIDTRLTRVAALTEDEARAITTEIQRTTVRLWLLVTEAHDRKAHQALGYETWADYVRAELNMSESRSYQFLDTGHVMKALAGAGVDVESFPTPPARVVARVKDRLSDVKKAATAALKTEDDPVKAVDKAVRALAREPRQTRGAAAGSEASAAGAPKPVAEREEVSCPACAGTGRVAPAVAERLLSLMRNLK